MRITSGGDQDPAEVRERIRRAEETRMLSDEMMLSAVTVPIYAVEGMPGRVSGSGSSDDRVTSVTVAHGGDDQLRHPNLRVQTMFTERGQASSERTLVASALARWLHDGLGGWSGGSDAAFVLKLRAHERARHQLACRATATGRVMDVDVNPTRFTHVDAGSRWAAVSRAGSLTITITATEVDPATVRLRAVQEPTESLI